MLAQPPPHKLPLGGYIYLVLGDLLAVSRDRRLSLSHQVTSSLIRGSIHARSRSEMNVPITVIMPISMMIVPAQEHVLRQQRHQQHRAYRRQTHHH